MASEQERRELDEKARQRETLVPGGTGGKNLEAQEHLAEGRSRGGQKRAEQLGQEGHKELGHKGGVTGKEQLGHEGYMELGHKGGETRKEQLGHEGSRSWATKEPKQGMSRLDTRATRKWAAKGGLAPWISPEGREPPRKVLRLMSQVSYQEQVVISSLLSTGIVV